MCQPVYNTERDDVHAMLHAVWCVKLTPRAMSRSRPGTGNGYVPKCRSWSTVTSRRL
jgi:hypothetical protein